MSTANIVTEIITCASSLHEICVFTCYGSAIPLLSTNQKKERKKNRKREVVSLEWRKEKEHL